MQRLGTLFIAFCMVMISGSLGALLYLVAGVPAAISGLAALTLLLGAGLVAVLGTAEPPTAPISAARSAICPRP